MKKAREQTDILREFRYERKYRLELSSTGYVNQIIRNHPASFKVLFPDRQINNVYFDYPDFSGYKLNLMGVGLRRKYRLRWYGEDYSQMANPQLEIKQRENELGNKIVKRIDKEDWSSLADVFDRHYPASAPLRPALLNAYQRSYFGCRQGRFRITIDRQQKFMPLADRQIPSDNWLKTSRFPYTDNALILELKYDQEFDAEAQDIMRYLPFRQSKNSKYVNGLSYLLRT
ncbi:MAG: VTC domain-containing protein [Bacteroidetes bacterium]|nr:VTC domain-containing protein [Bacteroidota bacterium]